MVGIGVLSRYGSYFPSMCTASADSVYQVTNYTTTCLTTAHFLSRKFRGSLLSSLVLSATCIVSNVFIGTSNWRTFC